MKYFIAITLITCGSVSVKAQNFFSGYEHLFITPLRYTASFTRTPPLIDGNIGDQVWEKASWSEPFQDIEGVKKPAPRLKTRMKLLWNDTHLFIAAEIEEPHLWANLTRRDQVIFYDNDFEIFIDPGNSTHDYFEVEMNALNTIFDLFLPKPYRNAGAAFIGWDAKGMRSAVKLHGTLNNPKDTDKGWTLELAIPFSAISIGNEVNVPKEGNIWRMNFSRVQWDTKVVNSKYLKEKGRDGKTLPEHNWVWSPQGVVNMHFPERWGYLVFTKQNKAPVFTEPYSEKQRRYLWLVYYKQKDFFEKYHKYAASFSELHIAEDEVFIDGKINRLNMEATTSQFTVVVSDGPNGVKINDEGLIQNFLNK